MVEALHPSLKDQPINLRVTRRQRDLIDYAAQVTGKSRTDFMLDATCREAEDVLLDRAFFPLDDDAFAAFKSAIDMPEAPSEGLKTLLKKPAPWE